MINIYINTSWNFSMTRQYKLIFSYLRFAVCCVARVDVGQDAVDGHVAQRVFEEEQLDGRRTD